MRILFPLLFSFTLTHGIAWADYAPAEGRQNFGGAWRFRSEAGKVSGSERCELTQAGLRFNLRCVAEGPFPAGAVVVSPLRGINRGWDDFGADPDFNGYFASSPAIVKKAQAECQNARLTVGGKAYPFTAQFAADVPTRSEQAKAACIVACQRESRFFWDSPECETCRKAMRQLLEYKTSEGMECVSKPLPAASEISLGWNSSFQFKYANAEQPLVSSDPILLRARLVFDRPTELRAGNTSANRFLRLQGKPVPAAGFEQRIKAGETVEITASGNSALEKEHRVSFGAEPPGNFTVQASSTLPAQQKVRYEPNQAVDGNYQTAWCADPKAKLPHWIELTGKPGAQKDTFLSLVVTNGYWKSAAVYEANQRLQKIRFEPCGGKKSSPAEEIVSAEPKGNSDPTFISEEIGEASWSGPPHQDSAQKIFATDGCVRLVFTGEGQSEKDFCVSEILLRAGSTPPLARE